MTPEPSRFLASTAIISRTTTDEVILEALTPFGAYIQKSIGPMSSISILPRIASNGSAELSLMESPATLPSSHPSTSDGSSNQSWIALPRRSLLAIQILSCVSVILLCGLLVGGPGLVNFEVPLACLLIACQVISCSLLTIPPQSSESGPIDPL